MIATVERYEFVVEGEPKAKGRPRFTKSGIAYTPKETATYENFVKVSFQNAYPIHVRMEGSIKATIIAYFGIPKSKPKKFKEQAEHEKVYPEKKPDCDNIAKTILDSLNGIAYEDDKQITDMLVLKRYSYIPRVEVILEPAL